MDLHMMNLAFYGFIRALFYIRHCNAGTVAVVARLFRGGDFSRDWQPNPRL